MDTITASFTDPTSEYPTNYEFSRGFTTIQHLEDYCDFENYLTLTSLTVNGIVYDSLDEYWYVQAQWDDAE